MFYLSFIGRLVRFYPVTVLFYASSLVLLTLSLQFEKSIEASLKEWSPPAQLNPYFYAIVASKTNGHRIARKMRSLPGVNQVEFFDKEIVSKKFDELLNQLKYMELKDFKLDYTAIKVELVNGLEMRSQKLIQNYLQKLAGINSIVGNLQESEQKVMPTDKWASYAPYFIQLMAGLLWIGALMLFLPKCGQCLRLLQQVQRTKHLQQLSFLGLHALILIPTIILSCLFGGETPWVSWPVMGVLLILVTMRLPKWQTSFH